MGWWRDITSSATKVFNKLVSLWSASAAKEPTPEQQIAEFIVALDSGGQDEKSSGKAVAEIVKQVSKTRKKKRGKKHKKTDDQQGTIMDGIVEPDNLTTQIDGIVADPQSLDSGGLAPSPQEIVAAEPLPQQQDSTPPIEVLWFRSGVELVQSSNVFAVGYEPVSQLLHIVFINLKELEAYEKDPTENLLEYVYPRYYILVDFTEEMFNEFISSKSLGGWYHEFVLGDAEKFPEGAVIHIWSSSALGKDSKPNDPFTLLN